MVPVKLFEPAAPSPPLRNVDPTIESVIQWYMESTARPRGKADKERVRIWTLFCESHGKMLVADVKPVHLFNFIEERKLGPWARRRWNSTVQRPFNYAQKLGLINRNPFHGLTYPEGDDGRDWTDEEFRAALRASAPHYRRILVFMRFSGARPGDARSIEWKMLGLNSILLNDHKTKKITRKPKRIFYKHVIVKLLAWNRRNNPVNSSHCFLNSLGDPWLQRTFNKAFEAVRKKAGFGLDVRPHGLRHTFATRAILNGVETGLLKELLGHGALRTTQRYMHVDKVEHLSIAMERAIGAKKRPE